MSIFHLRLSGFKSHSDHDSGRLYRSFPQTQKSDIDFDFFVSKFLSEFILSNKLFFYTMFKNTLIAPHSKN